LGAGAASQPRDVTQGLFDHQTAAYFQCPQDQNDKHAGYHREFDHGSAAATGCSAFGNEQRSRPTISTAISEHHD
jgi:hypothetical protein